ncbi:Uncharacterised protein [Klebsiella variicola]|nr:Uncharacterised protein [Klebsiella variicola]
MGATVNADNRLPVEISQGQWSEAEAFLPLQQLFSLRLLRFGIKATDSCGGSVTCSGPSSVASQKESSLPCGVSRQ